MHRTIETAEMGPPRVVQPGIVRFDPAHGPNSVNLPVDRDRAFRPFVAVLRSIDKVADLLANRPCVR